MPSSATNSSSDLAGLTAPARPSFARRVVLDALSALRRGRLQLELPGGAVRVIGEDASAPAVIRVRRESFFSKCLWSGDIGFAEAYIDGDWDTPDLTAVIAHFVRNVDDAPTLSGSRRAAPIRLNVLRIANRVRHLLRSNTRSIARRNISEHYDLSNDFFSLWLDPSMMYSSARWPADAAHLSLEEAQREKNETLCRHLRLRPSDHVLEIGTGWGSWSLHAARTHGCRVTTVTISRQQHDLAVRRVAEAGLTGRVDVRLQDFRDITGRFDKLVSIEMLEAVGHRNQEAFAEMVARVLPAGGIAALQFITWPDSRYEEFRGGVDFIQKHIFPGSLLLSVNRMNDLLARTGGFVLHRLEDFGTDYARTLRLWRESFHARLDAVHALGFDERFVRKWTYYLCYCEAAFALRNISVVHTVHTRPNNAAL
ncbi:MAG: class I SAM-dependent methyltransferase [Opitutaceae bacterium]